VNLFKIKTMSRFVAFCVGVAGAFAQDNGAAKSEADPVVGRWKVAGNWFWEFQPDGTIKLFESNGEAPRKKGNWNLISPPQTNRRYQVMWEKGGPRETALLTRNPEALIIESQKGFKGSRVQPLVNTPADQAKQASEPVIGSWSFKDAGQGPEDWRIDADGTAIHRWGAAKAAWKRGTWRLVSETSVPRRYEVSWGGDAPVSFVFTSSPEKLLVKKAKGGADWMGTRAPGLVWK
jgi:hypothetical protein